MSGRRKLNGPKERAEPTLGDLDLNHLEALGKPPAPVDDGLPQVSASAEGRRAGSRRQRDASAPDARPPSARTIEPEAADEFDFDAGLSGHRPLDRRAVAAAARDDTGRSPPRRSGGGRGRRGWLWPLLLLLVLGVGTALWLNQNALRGMLPRTDFNTLLNRGQSALQSGHLDGNDGTSARELFQAARSLEPDSDRARDGLRRVGEAALAQARQQLEAGQLDAAALSAASARQLLGGGSESDRLDSDLADARAVGVHTGDLVDQARQALQDGKLDGPTGAGSLFQRVLTADPGNAVAAHGLDQVGRAYAAQARQQLVAHDATAGTATIDTLAALLPNYNDLPALRAELAQEQQRSSVALTDALAQGTAALRSGRVAGAGEDTALAHYQAALAIDPNNADAKAGLANVAQALTVQASAMLDSGDAAQARGLLAQAATLAPGSPDLAAAQARLSAIDGSGGAGGSRESADILAPVSGAVASAPAVPAANPPGTVSPELSPAQQAKLTDMVSRAAAAARRGDIMSPPGQSAYDLYRSALAINGNDAGARNGLDNLPGLVVARFNAALGNGNLHNAGDMLGTLGDLAPGNPGQGAMRQRLADAWAAQIGKQLDDNDRAGASQSLDQLSKLAPADPRLPSLSARLAGGG